MKQDETNQRITLTDLILSVSDGQDGAPTRPIIRSATLEVTDQVFRAIVATILGQERATPVGTLRFHDAQWVDGGALISLRLKAGPMPATVTIHASLEATPSGRLLVRLTRAKAGPVPFTLLLIPLVEQLAERPGFYKVDDLAFEIDIGEQLRAQNVPLEFSASVREVAIRPGLARLVARDHGADVP